MMALWTDEAVERLRTLLGEGLTASQAAKVLSDECRQPCSRSAVIGKASRMGIAFTAGKKGGRHAQATPKPAVRRLTAVSVAPVADLRPVPLFPPRAPLVSEPPTGGVAFLERKSSECAWPLWPDTGHTPLDEKRVCGAAVETGQSYCPRCCARASQGGQRPATQVAA